jgi:ABC-type microcin C transport system permease subunit YejE
MHNVARVILTIVIPILFGVLAGMLTYLIGMFVGTGIALLWHTIRARRQRYSRIQLEDTDDEEEVLIYAKEGFVEEDADIDTPPFYVEIEGSEVRQQ